MNFRHLKTWTSRTRGRGASAFHEPVETTVAPDKNHQTPSALLRPGAPGRSARPAASSRPTRVPSTASHRVALLRMGRRISRAVSLRLTKVTSACASGVSKQAGPVGLWRVCGPANTCFSMTSEPGPPGRRAWSISREILAPRGCAVQHPGKLEDPRSTGAYGFPKRLRIHVERMR